MRLTLKRLGPATVHACEALGFLALYLAPEVDRLLLLAPLVFGILAGLLRVRLRDIWLLLFVAGFVFGGYATAATDAATGMLVARSLIPAHALLWLAHEERRYRYWRLGLAFIEIVLAAILAPEAYMFILIFFFVIVSSLALSFGFLERNFELRDKEAIGRPLRPSFVGAVVLLSVVIFLSSLVIFPLLPRAKWQQDDLGSTQAGYKEQVSFRHSTLFWAKPDSRPTMWLFRSSSRSWADLVPYGLLRGQSLASFNGVEWRAVGKQVAKLQRVPANNTDHLEVLRQSLPTEVLPVPYFASHVEPGLSETVSRYTSGEWMSSSFRDRAVKYHVEVGTLLPRDLEEERPRSADLLVDRKKFPQIVQLAESLANGAASDQDKVRSLLRHFGTQGYTHDLGVVEAATPERHPVNTFLFEKKSGHCELFATASILLLRAMGVPARIVAGFRVRPPNRGDVLTVHASDAHAWVEVWQEGRGWVPVDPTPVATAEGWIVVDYVGELYDWVGAYWNRYILGYQYQDISLRSLARPIALGIVGLLCVAWVLIALRKRKRAVKPTPRMLLPKVLAKLEEELLFASGIYPEDAFRKVPEGLAWMQNYLQLRFGHYEATREDLRALQSDAKALIKKTALTPRLGN